MKEENKLLTYNDLLITINKKLDLLIKQSKEKHLNLFLGDLVCKDIIQIILEKY
jgi:hypothetical protein